jgi:hypothetical protein
MLYLVPTCTKRDHLDIQVQDRRAIRCLKFQPRVPQSSSHPQNRIDTLQVRFPIATALHFLREVLTALSTPIPYINPVYVTAVIVKVNKETLCDRNRGLPFFKRPYTFANEAFDKPEQLIRVIVGD